MNIELIRAGAGVVQRADGAVLVARRAAHKRWGGWWEFPGGRIEPGETPGACIVRELREELALEVRVVRPLVTGLHPPEPGRRIVVLAYLAHLVAGQPRGTDHSEVRWLPCTRLQEVRLLPADVVIAEVVGELVHGAPAAAGAG